MSRFVFKLDFAKIRKALIYEQINRKLAGDPYLPKCRTDLNDFLPATVYCPGNVPAVTVRTNAYER